MEDKEHQQDRAIRKLRKYRDDWHEISFKTGLTERTLYNVLNSATAKPRTLRLILAWRKAR